MVSEDPNLQTQVTKATYDGGVLRPLGGLNLQAHQRVRVIVQGLEGNSPEERAATIERLRAGIAGMNFTSTNGYPTRDERHDRR